MNRILRYSHYWLLCYLAIISAPLLISAQSQNNELQEANDEVFNSETLTTIESRRQALSKLEESAKHLRTTGHVEDLVRTLNRIGEILLKLNDLDSAAANSIEARALARQSGNELLLADSLIFAATVSRYRGDNKAALQLLDEARLISLRISYRQGQAQSLTESGVVYLQQSELAKAEASEWEALRICRELQDKQCEARALFNLGEAYMRLSKPQQAEDALEQAATLWRELGYSISRASALIDLNFLAIRQGQWQKALTRLYEAQALISDKETEPFMAGQIAASLGEVYEAYGQLDKALSYFEESLVLYRDHVHDMLGTIDVGRKVGLVRARLGDYAKAVQQIEQGLQIAKKIDNRFMAALCHEDLGKVHLTIGAYEKAKQDFLEAIELYKQNENSREWGRAQSYLGQTDYLLGNQEAAAKSYRKALNVFQKIEDYTNEAALCFGLGRLELERQNLDEAGHYLKRSIELTERLRENAASKDLRSSFLASVHDRYEAYVEWLMQSHSRQPGNGLDVKAFEASEMGRARALLDSLKDTQRELRHVADPVLLLEEEKLQKEEQKFLDERARLQSEGGAPEDRQKVENELMRVRARYETLEAEINSSAKFNNLMRPAPLSLADIRKQVIDSETVLLEYSLGSTKSYLWVVRGDDFSSYELPDKNTVEHAAHKLAELLAKPTTDPYQEEELRGAISEVSRIVLGPVGGALSARRLIIVSDGILQYIPFQILSLTPDTNEPLIAHYEIVNAPSASALSVIQQEAVNRPIVTKLLAAFGAPEFSSSDRTDTQIAKRGQSEESDGRNGRRRSSEDRLEETLDPSRLQPLFFARQELNELSKLAPADKSVIYTGYDATRDNLRNLDLRQYRILHFATHGFLNARQPELSGLVLSRVDRNGQPLTGFIGLSDIYNLHAPVDLVVLSACRTALGKDMRGEGLVGLTRGFMYAGASSVVASLWKVDDEATSELMKRFYGNMLQKGMTPSAALRAAQISIRQEQQWNSPYYWAAFTLQGEYRQVIKPAQAVDGPDSSRRIIISLVLLTLLVVVALWYYTRVRRTAH